MLLKDKLRKFNRKLRHHPLYDRLYRRLHALLRGGGASKYVKYYHENYGEKSIELGLVLLDSFWGRMIGCNPYALYLEMRADPRCAKFRYIWVCDDRAAIPDDMRNDPAVSFVVHQSMPFQDALLTAQYLIGNTNFPTHFVKKEDQVYINPWHGTPIKHIGRDADARLVASANTQRNYFMSDYILSYSQTATDRTVKAYHAHDALDQVHHVGTPRLDLTLNANRSDIRGQLAVESDKPVLLYAPTWRGSFGSQDKKSLETQVAHIQWISETFRDTHEVFVSIHHITATALKETGVPFQQPPQNIPINQVLAGVDALITDYSSIMVDFLVLDRPIILFCPDYDTFSTTQGFYIDLKSFPAAFCKSYDALIAAIQSPRAPSDFESYTMFKTTHLPLEDGQASKRSLDLIFDNTTRTAQASAGKIRLLFYGGGLFPNGITSSLISLTNAIASEKYDITIVIDAQAIDDDFDRQINIAKLPSHCRFVTRSGATTYTPQEAESYARFRQTGRFTTKRDRTFIDAAFQREARRIFGDLRFDVAIDFSGYGPFWTLIFSHANVDRRIIYQHADMFLEANNPNSARSFPELPAVFALYERFDGIVSVTAEMQDVNKRNLAKYYRPDTAFFSANNVILSEVIRTKANVPINFVCPHVAAITREKDTYLFCCVARLSPEKNHVRLLDAFAKVLKENRKCVLLIMGTGKLADTLEAHARRLGIQDFVLFLGHRENPYAIMNACDCKVLASHYEGQGIVLLEALTLGLKCIATDNPAIRSVLKDGLGTVVPQDTDALAKAMLAAAEAGKTKDYTFDPDNYANQALQQFYKTLSSTSS